jgi:hypothetical protein
MGIISAINVKKLTINTQPFDDNVHYDSFDSHNTILVHRLWVLKSNKS